MVCPTINLSLFGGFALVLYFEADIFALLSFFSYLVKRETTSILE